MLLAVIVRLNANLIQFFQRRINILTVWTILYNRIHDLMVCEVRKFPMNSFNL